MIKITEVIKYVESQVGLPYWWGTYGQIATNDLLIQKRNQYPTYYANTDFKQQIGKRVHDCSGLFKACLMGATIEKEPKYNSQFDLSAKGFYTKCKEKGTMGNFKPIDGTLLFRGNGITHIGMYINGYVIHAKGHAYGVVREKFSSANWNNWGICDLFDYSATGKKSNKTITQLANEVINGDWGNGTERKKNLEANGYNYDKVQKKVNSILKRKGE